MKTHWKQLVNSDYIGAYSLQPGQDLTVIIEKVVRELVTGDMGKKEECTIAYLKDQKPFIVNRTNAKTISKLYSPYIEDWVGKKITLFASTTRLKGEDVECLRIRQNEPQKEELTPDHKKWGSVKKGLKNGYTLDQIKEHYIISLENEKLLNETV